VTPQLLPREVVTLLVAHNGVFGHIWAMAMPTVFPVRDRGHRTRPARSSMASNTPQRRFETCSAAVEAAKLSATKSMEVPQKYQTLQMHLWVVSLSDWE
jgi:hypothetical protein